MAAKAKRRRNPRSPNEIDKAVGERLRALRLERGRTLSDLASEIGISHQQLQKYETGANRISVGTLPAFAEALQVDLMEFYGPATGGEDNASSKADRLRKECAMVLKRVKTEERLSTIVRAVKALVD